jgi:hypothetical protein
MGDNGTVFLLLPFAQKKSEPQSWTDTESTEYSEGVCKQGWLCILRSLFPSYQTRLQESMPRVDHPSPTNHSLKNYSVLGSIFPE